jgi:hypothetical protein
VSSRPWKLDAKLASGLQAPIIHAAQWRFGFEQLAAQDFDLAYQLFLLAGFIKKSLSEFAIISKRERLPAVGDQGRCQR